MRLVRPQEYVAAPAAHAIVGTGAMTAFWTWRVLRDGVDPEHTQDRDSQAEGGGHAQHPVVGTGHRLEAAEELEAGLRKALGGADPKKLDREEDKRPGDPDDDGPGRLAPSQGVKNKKGPPKGPLFAC